jgi:hypothetical protein
MLDNSTALEAPTMTIDLIDANLIPPTAFVRRSRMLESKDWRDAVAALPTIKPGKAVRIALSPETLEMSKNAGIAFKRHLVDHIKEAKLKLDVALRKAPDGIPVLYVSNPPAK